MPSKLRKAILAVKDQTSISLARVSSSQYTDLEVAILKATTHDDIPIDERYVYEVVDLVSSDKVYAAACAAAIGKRIGRTRNWIVALKSLLLVLRIFQDGDPYFPREVLHAMKRGAKILNLSGFRDDSNSSPWDYTAFVRTFALYLDERLDCFLTGKLQRRYTKIDRRRVAQRDSSRTNDSIRDMKPAVLLDRIAFWQRLLDRAIATRPTGAARTNRLVQICLYAVVQESFNLYKDISDGLTLLIDGFFHLQYKNCVNAFQTCVLAAKQYEELGEFYSVCKSMGVGTDSEYPTVKKISEELLDTLQEFLKDQSSFPSVSKSPNRPALPPVPNSYSTRQESYRSYGSPENSRRKMSPGLSEFGSRRPSLEELISATETGMVHGISIDLEDYPHHFDQISYRDETCRMSHAGSTQSLPVSNSMADLISLDDWPGQEQETETTKDHQKETNAPTGWELVLTEAIQVPSTQSENNAPNTFNAFPEQNPNTFDAFPEQNPNTFDAFPEQKQKTFNAFPEQDPNTLDTQKQKTFNAFPEQDPNAFNAFPEQKQKTLNAFPEEEQEEQDSRKGWELVLAETATQHRKHSFDLDSLYNQQVPNVSNTFNAFQGQEQKGQNWELVLFDNTKQPQQSPFSVDSFHNQPTSSPQFPLDSFHNQPTQSPSFPPATFHNQPTGSPQFPLNSFQKQPTQSPPFPLHTFHNQPMPLPPFSLDSFHNQPKTEMPPKQHYNPFLDDSNELAIVPINTTSAGFEAPLPPNTYVSPPTFQATPTFSSQTPDNGTGPYGSDPFSAVAGTQMFEGSRNQQNLMHEQQLWLQQQNKIIAKHRA